MSGTLFASILIGDKSWLWPACALLLIGLLCLWYGYRVAAFAGPARFIAAALKAAGIALLAICLVDPLWSGMRARPGSNIFVLLADNSQSLNVREPGEKQSRGERMRELLSQEKVRENEETWQSRLGQEFDVRREAIDSKLMHVDDFAQLTFDGVATSIGQSLDTLRERFRDRPLAGVMLFTDGNATDLNSKDWDLTNMPPLYPVVFGSAAELLDLAIRDVAISQTSFEDAPVSLQADVVAWGYARQEIVAQVLDAEGNIVEEASQKVDEPQATITYRFQLKPQKPGISFYRLRVSARSELPQFDTPETTREATLANNTRLLKIDRGRGPYRVLYVTGRPNWEFKFLRRAVADDDQIDLVGLIRVAKREAKFDFRGRAGESSNPLFRGFKKEGDEETESYDQAVLVRLNTKNAAELREGFPRSAEQLYQYTAVIIDDVEADFFTPDQKTLLDRYVSLRGGGLLMLGGQESFREGGYDRTPIGDMLPVYLDRTAVVPPETRYRLKLTRYGWLQPWVRLRDNEADETKRLGEMSEFHTLNQVGSLKPGATALATVTDTGGKEHPALVVQQFGKGRSAVLTIGDMWRWHLRRDDPSNEDMLKAWRQTLRWLVADVPHQVEMHAEPQPRISNTAIKFRIKARDEEFQSLDNATVKVTITPPAGEAVTLDAEASLDEPGSYETVYVPRESGAYLATAVVSDEAGQPAPSAEIGWTTNPAEQEFRSIAVNQQLMQDLAEATGGEVVRAERLDDFVESLSTRKMPVTERWTYPLWDQPAVFLLALVCLIGEWGVRRWKGLP